MSTAYCQCKEAVLEEKFYAAGENPYGMIEMAKTLSNDILEDITPK